MSLIDIVALAGSVFIGLLAGLFALRQRQFDERELLVKAEVMGKEVDKEKKRILEQAKEHVVLKKQQFVTEQEEFMSQLEKMEQVVSIKTGSTQKRETKNAEIERQIRGEEQNVEAIKHETEKHERDITDRLLKSTGLSYERLKEEITKYYEDDFQKDAESRLQRDIEWAQECATRDSKNILAEAIYRFSDDTFLDHGEGTVKVARDEVKGRLIGRGGRTIAFFEELFQVDVIFNDEPNTIIVSCFNIVQREIARLALERLMREKNITEESIKNVKLLAEQDMDKILRRSGETSLKTIGLQNMAPDFAKLVGRLQFRTSYGQNVLRHSFEVGYFARLLASAIGANEHVAFLGGFFHDIGKAIDQEVGGSHDVLSKEILEKYGFSWEITHAAWTHHNAIPQETVEARIVQAADAISAGRPGARAESLERYLTKIKDLQETALSFEGTKKAFAINAGREVRVIVEPEKVSDARMEPLAKEIAAKVQEKGGYPGRIKITTIRVTKVTDYARK